MSDNATKQEILEIQKSAQAAQNQRKKDVKKKKLSQALRQNLMRRKEGEGN